MQPVTRPVAESRTSRLDWIDAAKGLGIVLIVIGHIYSVAEPSPLYVFIYAFHVPLFFFIAGLTYRLDPPSLPAFFRKKLRALLVPYLCYAALGYVFYLAGYWAAARSGLKLEQFNHGLFTPFIGIFYGSLGDGHLVNTPVWFVIALFCTLMIGHLLRRHALHAPDPGHGLEQVARELLGAMVQLDVRAPGRVLGRHLLQHLGRGLDQAGDGFAVGQVVQLSGEAGTRTVLGFDDATSSGHRCAISCAELGDQPRTHASDHWINQDAGRKGKKP